MRLLPINLLATAGAFELGVLLPFTTTNHNQLFARPIRTAHQKSNKRLLGLQYLFSQHDSRTFFLQEFKTQFKALDYCRTIKVVSSVEFKLHLTENQTWR